MFPAFKSVHLKTNFRKCNSPLVWLIPHFSCPILKEVFLGKTDANFASSLCSLFAPRVQLETQNIEIDVTSSHLFYLLPVSRQYRPQKGLIGKLQTGFTQGIQIYDTVVLYVELSFITGEDRQTQWNMLLPKRFSDNLNTLSACLKWGH